MEAWEFVDAMLAEAEAENKACMFRPSQVVKLREMIAEIPKGDLNGKKRSRLSKDGSKYVTHTIRVPVDVHTSINNKAVAHNQSFNMYVVQILQDYIERTKQ